MTPPADGSARLVLVTGKGGVGKTTLSAAQAVRVARSGQRTCVISTDPAHSLGDALGVELTAEPTEVEPGLWAAHLDPRHAMRQSWAELHSYLTRLATDAGVSAVQANEVAVIPGLDDVITLAAVADMADHEYDVVIVDCAPSAETIRLFSLPHVLGWWLEQLLQRLPNLGALAPLVRDGLGIPLPSEDAGRAGAVLLDRLRAAQRVLNDPRRTSVMLVATPEPMVVAETRRTATYLSLFDFPLQSVVANRTLGADAGLDEWHTAQVAELERLVADFAPLTVTEVPQAAGPVWGPDALAELAAHLPDDATAADAAATVRFDAADPPVLRVPVRGVATADVDLGRRGDELHVRLGPYRRVVALPASLHDRAVARARLHDGELVVAFEELA